jgi:TatD DNase family protein
MIMLIDTHAHLTYPPLSEETDQVIARAREAGVTRIFTVGTSPDDSHRAVALAQKYDTIFAVAGIHPNEADAHPSIDELKPLLTSPKVLAIGETGLDYHHTDANRENQHRLFNQHIELARQANLPLIVHCREAFDDALDIIRSAGSGVRGIFHCFSGNKDQAATLIEMGWTISFSGTVTFKNAGDLRQTALAVGPDHILVETDCPFLSPEPVRKIRTNEPAFVAHTARLLSDLFKMPLEQFAEKTWKNAQKVFGSRFI